MLARSIRNEELVIGNRSEQELANISQQCVVYSGLLINRSKGSITSDRPKRSVGT